LVPLLAAACSVEADVSRQFLRPAGPVASTPADFGIAAEDVRIDVADGELHGWFLPCAQAEGRTVVLCHDNGTNIGDTHRYYRMLHGAGFQVLVFDYRGYGDSTGAPSINGLIHDMREVVAWLRDEPRVDRKRTAWFGIGLGAIPAAYAAARQTTASCGLVLDNAMSARMGIARALEEGGSDAVGATTYIYESFSLADGLETIDNVAALEVPLLLIVEPGASEATWSDHLLAWEQAPASRRAMWALADAPAAAVAPAAASGSSESAGDDYAATITAFLRACCDGATPRRVTVEWEHQVDVATTERWIEATLTAVPGDDPRPLPWTVDLVAVPKEGDQRVLQRVTLERPSQTLRLPIEVPVRTVAAHPVR